MKKIRLKTYLLETGKQCLTVIESYGDLAFGDSFVTWFLI